jgi:hypothetical protein
MSKDTTYLDLTIYTRGDESSYLASVKTAFDFLKQLDGKPLVRIATHNAGRDPLGMHTHLIVRNPSQSAIACIRKTRLSFEAMSTITMLNTKSASQIK